MIMIDYEINENETTSIYLIKKDNKKYTKHVITKQDH